MKIGVISDTHGLLRPEALDYLRGSDHILHAGDVGDADILIQLQELAPLRAIRGNIDRKPPCSDLPVTEAVELGGHLFYLVHAIADLDLDPVAASISAVITGHSHQPSISHNKGVLFLNPGSAGPRRFRLPVSIASLFVEGPSIRAEIHTLSLTPTSVG